MDSPFGSDEALIGRLPLPLAQLYRRAHNAKTPLERHLTAYYLWEAALKVLASVALVEHAEGGRHDPKLAERLRNLARPSLGHWWEFVRLLVPTLADAGDGDFGKVREVLLGRARDDLPRAAGLDALLRESLDGQGGARSTVRLSELFDRLVRYRNRELGHGAAGRHPAEFHERMGRALLAGIAELLDRLDVLAGRRLLFVAEVRRQTSGAWLVERYHLAGEAPRRLESLEVAAAETAALPRPDRVYQETAATGGPPRLRSLYGLLVYDAEAGEALFLNARRGRRQVEYLSYTTGRTAEQPDAGDQRALLARLVGEAVTAEQTADWVTRSYAEEQQTTAPAEDPGGPGRQVGEFELLSELGRGGMGVVYRAWQPSLGRQVALKCMLKAGDPKAEARFAREIRALGRVEHPNLVKVFTSGSVGEQWFYAMELVDGATLAAVCDEVQTRAAGATVVDLPAWHEKLGAACAAARQAEKPLGEHTASGGRLPPDGAHNQGADAPRSPGAARSYVRHLAGLVRQVAEAAHALHEAGVIHRDIKPGNIMVTADDRHAILMDLGLAQLADEAEGRLTRTRQFVGTLRYASPEQVLAAGRLDRRTDVYSLGATLWEMLTLRPLFGATEQTPTPDLMQWIQYREPEAPRKYHPGLPRDLEAIVLKCLEKDPARRYATARELADDLGRFLAGEPVQARRAGRLERGWRWCRRNPVVAGSATLIAVALLAGTGFSSYFAVQANRRADEERRQKERADREAEEARQARDRAETNFRLAVATNASVGDLAERLKPIAGTQTRTVQEILDLAGRNYDRLLAETGATPEALEGKARMLASFSEVYLAMNRSRQAAASAREALGIWQRLLARDPDRLAWCAGLARSRQVLGQALGTQGDTPAALAAFQSSLHLRQRLAAEEPDNTERQAEVALSQHLVGAALHGVGDEGGAEKAYREALRLREDLARRDPADARRQRDLAVTRQAVGDILWNQGKKADAAALYRQALAQLKAVTRQHPDNAEWQGELSHAYFNVAYVFEDGGSPRDMRLCLQESLAILRRLLDADPGNAVWQRQASTARQKLADVLTDPDNLTRERILGVLRERAEGLAQDLALAEARADDDPDNVDLRYKVALLHLQTAALLTGPGRLGEAPDRNFGQALAWCRRALEDSTRLIVGDPENMSRAAVVAEAHDRAGNVLSCQGKAAEALEESLAGDEAMRRAYADRLRRAPDDAQTEGNLALYCLSAGMNRVQLARRDSGAPAALEGAVRDLEEARSHYQALAEREPGNRSWLGQWQQAVDFLAQVRSLQGDPAAAALHQEAGRLKAKLAELPPAPNASITARRPPTSIFGVATQLSMADRLAGPPRGMLEAAEMRFALSRRSELTPNIVAACRLVARVLTDVPTRETYAEARRCYRRALALLQALRRDGKLDQGMQSWPGEVQADLEKLPPDPEAAGLGDPVQAARDDLDYRRAAALLVAAHRQNDLVRLLVRDYRDSAHLTAWRARLVAGIAFEPKLLAEVTQAARALRKDGPAGLDAEGRRLVALLAWCGEDERTASEFVAGLPAAAPDIALIGDVEQVLLGARRFHDRARFLARLISPLPVKANLAQYRYLAQAQLGAAQYEAAAATLGKVQEVEPNKPADRVTLGQVYLQQRRLAEARALFQQIVDTPRLPAGVQTQARYYLAFAYRELGEPEKAEAELARLLDAVPDRAAVQASLADFWVDQGKNLEQAEAQLRRQLQGQEDYPPYLAALGRVLCLRGRAEEGLRLLEQAAPAEDVADDPFFWDHLGDAYRLVKADDKARAAWRKALAVFPKTADPGDRRKAAIESKLQTATH